MVGLATDGGWQMGLLADIDWQMVLAGGGWQRLIELTKVASALAVSCLELKD